MGHPSSAVPKRRSRGTSSGCRGSRRAVLMPGIIVFRAFLASSWTSPATPVARSSCGLARGSLRARLSFPRRPPFAGIVSNEAQVVGQSYPTNLEAVADAVGRERVDLQARVAPDGTVTLLFTDIEGSTG